MARRSGVLRGRLSSPPLGVDPGPAGEFAVDFHDSGEAGVFRLTSDITGMVDSKVGVFAVWFYYAGSNIQVILNIDASNTENGRFSVSIDNNNRIAVGATRTSFGTVIAWSSDNASPVTKNSWHHLLMAWDTDADVLYAYVDDVDVWTNTTALINNAAIEYSRTGCEVQIAGGDLIGAPWRECLAQVWFDSNNFLDITVESNRRKFISSSAGPISLGPDGSLPLGTAPLIYLDNPYDLFRFNRGTGGDFTVFGTLSACADSPASPA